MKSKTFNEAASSLAKLRWKKATPEQRKEVGEMLKNARKATNRAKKHPS